MIISHEPSQLPCPNIPKEHIDLLSPALHIKSNEMTLDPSQVENVCIWPLSGLSLHTPDGLGLEFAWAMLESHAEGFGSKCNAEPAAPPVAPDSALAEPSSRKPAGVPKPPGKAAKHGQKTPALARKSLRQATK